MINQSSNDVIVHIAVEPSKVRFKGKDVHAFRPSHGFSWVEFDSGERHPISNPFEDWFLSIVNAGRTPGTGAVGTIHFVLEPAGERSNDGQDDKQTSVNNMQSAI